MFLPFMPAQSGGGTNFNENIERIEVRAEQLAEKMEAKAEKNCRKMGAACQTLGSPCRTSGRPLGSPLGKRLVSQF